MNYEINYWVMVGCDVVLAALLMHAWYWLSRAHKLITVQTATLSENSKLLTEAGEQIQQMEMVIAQYKQLTGKDVHMKQLTPEAVANMPPEMRAAMRVSMREVLDAISKTEN